MKTLSENLRTLSIMLLAASIFYFGYALIKSIDKVYLITDKAAAITESVDPLLELAPRFLDESERLRQMTAGIVAEIAAIRDAVPSILEESKAIRQTIPSILEESKAIRETIPPILKQTEIMRLESEAIRNEVALTRAEIPALLSELEAYRTLLPRVLDESERIRQTIPPTLDRVEMIVAQADQIASSAGENAFTGMITGIIKAPFKLVGSAASAIMPSGVEVSEADRAMLEKRLQSFIGAAKVGDRQSYVSEDGALTWRYQLLEETSVDNETCRVLALTSLKDQERVKSAELTICQGEKGQWYLKDSG